MDECDQKPPVTSPARLSSDTPERRFLKRREVALLLQVSEPTLRRKYEGKLLNVWKDALGHHVFDEAEVLRLRTTLRDDTENAEPPQDGALAARVFELLDENLHPVDIVKRLRVSPEAVSGLHRQWVHMRGALVFSRQQLDELAALAWPHSPPLTSERDLTGRIHSLLCQLESKVHSSCSECRRRPASVCVQCLKKAIAVVTEDHAQREHEKHMKELDRSFEEQRAQLQCRSQEEERERERRRAERQDDRLRLLGYLPTTKKET